MGYDCYVGVQACIPDVETGQAVLNLLEADDDWGVFAISEVGDEYLYFQWEGRNRDEDTVSSLLQLIALRHAITFEVEYSSDYESGIRFFVGVDAEQLNTLYQIDLVVESLKSLLAQPPQQLTPALKVSPRFHELEALVNTLSQMLVQAGDIEV